MRWVGQLYPANENVTYDSRTNQVIWNAGSVPAGTGVTSTPRQVEFQVGITPQINQAGQILVLTNKADFSAVDNFVSKNVSLSAPQKDTQLYEDPSVGTLNAKVSK